MTKFGDLSSKFWKTNVEFEISSFEIGHMGNFVKIKRLIHVDPKMPNWGFGLEIFKNK